MIFGEVEFVLFQSSVEVFLPILCQGCPFHQSSVKVFLFVNQVSWLSSLSIKCQGCALCQSSVKVILFLYLVLIVLFVNQVSRLGSTHIKC